MPLVELNNVVGLTHLAWTLDSLAIVQRLSAPVWVVNRANPRTPQGGKDDCMTRAMSNGRENVNS